MNLKQIIFMNVVISLVFSITMSFFTLWINMGLVPGFIIMWLRAIATGLTISLPLSFIFIPPIQRLAMSLFVKKEDSAETNAPEKPSLPQSMN